MASKIKRYFDVDLMTFNKEFHCEQMSHFKEMPEDYLNLLKKSCTCEDFISMFITFSYGVVEDDCDKKV